MFAGTRPPSPPARSTLKRSTSYSKLARWCAQLSRRSSTGLAVPTLTLASPPRPPQSSSSSPTNKPDVLKSKEEKVAESSSSALKSFISGGAGGVAAVLVGESPSTRLLER